MDYRIGFKVEPSGSEGSFDGYACVYDSVDAYGTKFAPGAFLNVLRDFQQEGRYPPIVWDHDKGEPIGEQTLISDSKGLRVSGKLWLDTEGGKKAYHLIRNTQYYMSFWATPKVGAYRYDSKGHKIYTDIASLYETTITSHPANRKAAIAVVRNDEGETKSAEQVSNDHAKVQEAIKAAKKEAFAEGQEAKAKEIEKENQSKREEEVKDFLSNWAAEINNNSNDKKENTNGT